MSSLYNMHLGRARTLFEEQLFQLRIKNLLHLLLYVGCCEVRDPMLKFHELEPNNLRNSRSFPISAIILWAASSASNLKTTLC